jgi:(S)-2-hydroxyglutarate dehydrogenase
MKICNDTEILICGAGIIGLSIGVEILRQKPDTTVMIIDKEETIGAHASTRNSGVIHAGFYYSPDSLKAKLTRDGNSLMKAYCKAEKIEVNHCGKVVVARNEDEDSRLDELFQRSEINGVEVYEVDTHELSRIEPAATTMRRALWSPTTSVVDPKMVLERLASEFTRLGGELRLKCAALSSEDDFLVTSEGGIRYGHFINCAGLYADQIAKWFNLAQDYEMLPFKGLYLYMPEMKGKIRRHIYPVPDLRNPFLGVHLTVSISGDVKVGPTAIPAISRENYSLLGGIRFKEAIETTKTLLRFFKSPNHEAGSLARQELPKYSPKVMLRQASTLAPSISSVKISYRGKPGIRAQLYDRANERLEMDFVIQEQSKSTHLLNSVSPAFTTSLATARHIVNRLINKKVL